MNTINNFSNARKIENLHIVFWLIKDLAWCMIYKPLGLLMIIPTLYLSLVFTFKTRTIKAELYHNLAVTLWIIANSYWMISEFFEFDALPIGIFTYKQLAVIPFGLGITILAYYYFIVQHKNKTLDV
jgi:hypothetical protein